MGRVDRKMKTNPDSLPSTPAVLLPYCRDCRDFSEWPERWMGEEKDLPVGRQLVEYFMPFLLHLAESGLSKRTIQNHVDNTWLTRRRDHPRREPRASSKKELRRRTCPQRDP